MEFVQEGKKEKEMEMYFESQQKFDSGFPLAQCSLF